MYVLILELITGMVVDMPEWSLSAMIEGISVFAFCSILTILLSSPVVLFATVGRGYLPPLGFMIFTIALAQIIAFIGYGHLFPWSIPAIASGITGNDDAMIEGASIIIVLLISIFGFISTILWWRNAGS
jgi:ABC-2 type transport system permease protein